MGNTGCTRSIQACGSCHFHAGADNRTKNQLNPNHLGGDLTTIFVAGTPDVTGANQEVNASHFPFLKLADETLAGGADAPGNVMSDTNDVMSSMGVVFHEFVDIPTPGPGAFGPAVNGVAALLPDLGNAVPDPVPVFQGLRRVEPRNTPTFFAAAMNFDNFWDGRARHDFNGGSVFGPSDPQSHVFVDDGLGLTATRQIIRFSSLASLSTGPALSNFEMSFNGRNWAKLGKKLLQPGVTPLAHQLVDPNDSVLGPYSGQRSTVGGPVDQPGRPGLNITYPELIQMAFYSQLWSNTTGHLNGAPMPCDPNTPALNGVVTPAGCDPFDGYVLSIAAGPASPTDTNQFTQMEANMPLFFGLSIQIWGNILIPDDTPMDRFFVANPDSHTTFGESGEPGIAFDHLRCDQTGGVQPCFTEVGNFKRDPDVIARIGVTIEGGQGGELIPSGGTRQPTDPDPLMGMDFFLGSNLSLKNPNFRSLRCGECHNGGTLTDHTFEISHQVSFGDRIQEFVTGQPGIELFPEALGRGRIISGFLLEGELQENAQDGIERNIADFELDAGGFPKGQAMFDNGVYNIGVRPIFEDVSRGGLDPWGWPLSLSVLALKNLGGVDYHPGGNNSADGFAQPATPGIPLPNFDPAIDPTG
ncbi:MAG: hypothetical protein HY801_01455, partial [Candidatus Lindowbacteria bacterium]|nr:hypothetical protein [Candidatus Lindowbacteria bacterium]